MVHHTLARPEMEAAWRRKAAYADKDTSIFLMISEEYDEKNRQGVNLQPCKQNRDIPAVIDTRNRQSKSKPTHARRDPQK